MEIITPTFRESCESLGFNCIISSQNPNKLTTVCTVEKLTNGLKITGETMTDGIHHCKYQRPLIEGHAEKICHWAHAQIEKGYMEQQTIRIATINGHNPVVIDGQHRICAFTGYPSCPCSLDVRELFDNIELIIIADDVHDDSDLRSLFVRINKNARIEDLYISENTSSDDLFNLICSLFNKHITPMKPNFVMGSIGKRILKEYVHKFFEQHRREQYFFDFCDKNVILDLVNKISEKTIKRICAHRKKGLILKEHANIDPQLFPHEDLGSCICQTQKGYLCKGRIGGPQCVNLEKKTKDSHYHGYGYCAKHSGIYSKMSFSRDIHEFKKRFIEERIDKMEFLKTPMVFVFKIGEDKNWLDMIYEEFQKEKEPDLIEFD
jgi:hypothetical protein